MTPIKTLLNPKVWLPLLGGLVAVWALGNLPSSKLDSGFLLLAAITCTLVPRLALTLPRSNFAISFSDAAVFLTFLLYGGPAAVVISALDVIANLLYLRYKGARVTTSMIAANASLHALSMALTYFLWLNTPQIPGVGYDANSTPHLIATLAALAFSHFIFSSLFAAALSSAQTGIAFLTIWRRDVLTSWMTQIVGAVVAGVAFSVLHFGDALTAVISFGALAVVYVTYRQSIEEIKLAMRTAEEAERIKSETEREGRRAAERHAEQLKRTLEKEERTSEALRKSERDFAHAALHDSLTQLPNRKHLGDILRAAIADYKADPSKTFHVLFLDISRFKIINDSLGHLIGDKVLIIAAKRFARMLNADDVVARIGGDEFAVVLRGPSTTGKAQKVARRIYDSIGQPFSLSGNNISLTINVGIAPCDEEYNSPEEILRDADIAMHYAKDKKTGVAIFTKDLRTRFLERIRFENDLRSAIDRDELSMNYQPIIDLHDGKLLGFESLLRWNHAELGNVPPAKFVPVAEDSGLIIPITVWILQQTCLQIVRWQKIAPRYRDIIVTVNISGKHLTGGDLVADVEDALALSKLEPSCLKLEITESVAMENAEHTINVLKRLKALGVKLSLDDFGTGYSSLSVLQKLPFDTLKIDRSFVSGVGENGENSEMLQTIISLAKNLKMRVVAEGIETIPQLSLLQNLGCDYGQGYLFAKPKTVDGAENALYESSNWMPAELRSQTDEAAQDAADEQLPVF
jgi:diguanylate cyclase (GGDEF)-like protein